VPDAVACPSQRTGTDVLPIDQCVAGQEVRVPSNHVSRRGLGLRTGPALAALVALALAGCASLGPAATRPPDGWILFVNAGLGSEGIYRMNPDGTALRRIATAAGPGLSWSPDGRRIVFTSNPGISVMNADGSNVTQLASTGENPAWSPDGRRVAFTFRPNESLIEQPPDAAKIDLIKQEHLQLMNADGSSRTGLTDGPVGDEWPSWSPDGTRVAFSRNLLPPFTEGDCSGICLINVDGSGLLQLPADGGDPNWSPDGLTMAFASSAAGRSGIWVIGLDGSKPVNLTPNLAPDLDQAIDFSHPAWSPDGRRIAFAHGPNRSAADVWIVDSDGSNLTRLTQEAGFIWGISWR